MIRARATVVLFAFALALGTSRTASADDASEGTPAGPRIGLVPGAGAGVAAMISPSSHFPAVIGLTTFQIELVGETPRIGGFLRGAFHSSGPEGRWTAPAIAAGAGYRLFGDGETTWSLTGRAGLLYERWHASSGGCSVYFFFPNSCVDLVAPPPPNTKTIPVIIHRETVDMIGLLAAARLEAPTSAFYLAFGAEASGTGDLSQASPGAVLQLEFTISISFRSRQYGDESQRSPYFTPAKYRDRAQ